MSETSIKLANELIDSGFEKQKQIGNSIRLKKEKVTIIIHPTKNRN